jgi:hypothetical protein
MNNSHAILKQILGLTQDPTGAVDRLVDDFLTFVEMDVMAGLIEALPEQKHQQIIDQFINLPHSSQKAEQIFSPYYTQEYMRETLKNATKRAIVQHFVEPRSARLTPSERDSILALLEELDG